MLMRITLCVLAAALSIPPAQAADGDATTIVGVLTLQHTERCDGTWESEWVDPHHEVGFTRLIPVEGVDLTAWEGKLVVVRGRAAPLPKSTVASTGECPPRQARSDWIFAKNGVRLRRDWPQAHPAAMTAAAVTAFDGLTVRRDGDSLHLRFTNTLPGVPLDSVELVVHYEGCYGKPNTRTRHAKLGMIAPGAHVDAALPSLDIDEDMGRGRAVHRAWSVQATCMNAEVLFAVDASLGLFEAGRVECPERNRKTRGAEPPMKTKH
jgi:hypothetical protein